jgi:hypothetical protein
VRLDERGGHVSRQLAVGSWPSAFWSNDERLL